MLEQFSQLFHILKKPKLGGPKTGFLGKRNVGVFPCMVGVAEWFSIARTLPIELGALINTQEQRGSCY